jgi:hypothetical protein
MRITRSELYEQVWTEPMSKLAKRYGLSDRGLAKICGRNDIPCPPRGYWAKKQSGHGVHRKPLPRKDIDQTIEIPSNPLDGCNSELKEEMSLMKNRSNPIVVSDSLRNPHPLIKQSAQILNSCEPDNLGIVVAHSKENCLDIRVSKKNLSRSLRIMDALIKALESHGYEVSISKKSTDLKIYDVSLSFAIYEELRHRRLEAKNLDLNGYYQFGYNQYDKQPTPTGNLCLTINDPGFWRGGTCRQNWNDGKSQRIEDCLNSFISGLLKTATLKKKHIQEEQVRQKEKDGQP